MRCKSGQRGNIFALLFASTALVGVLGVTAMNVLQGPITTMTRVMQKSTAEANMLISARVLLNIATDFDADGFNEPPAHSVAGASPAPIGGGLLPSSLGLALTDSWGTGYGYCVYDHGADNTSTDRLTGDNTAGAPSQTLLAVVAAGPDKTFQTTCNAFSSGPVDVSKSGGSDDIIIKYSYAEAAASSSGLWTLNASDQNKAELKDNGGAVAVSVDRSGGIINAVAISTATISAPSTAFDTLSIGGGFLLDTSAGTATVCGAGQTGSLRLDAPKTGLEICSGATWGPLRSVPVVAGADKLLQFNDNGTQSAAASLRWDKSTSQFLIGDALASGSTTYLAQVAGTGGNAGLSIDRYSSSAAGNGKIVLRRARGTPSAPAAVVTGDALGQITFGGYVAGAFPADGSNSDVLIQAHVTGTAADASNMGAKFRIFVKPDGATTVTERLTILSTGFTGVSNNLPHSMLDVGGAVQVADDAAACVSNKNGAIRFTSDALQVCRSAGWQAVATNDTWGRINGAAATIAYGSNLASVTKNATGDWSIIYSSSLSSADYAAFATPYTTSASRHNCQIFSVATGSARVRCFNGSTAADVNFFLKVVGP